MVELTTKEKIAAQEAVVDAELSDVVKEQVDLILAQTNFGMNADENLKSELKSTVEREILEHGVQNEEYEAAQAKLNNMRRQNKLPEGGGEGKERGDEKEDDEERDGGDRDANLRGVNRKNRKIELDDDEDGKKKKGGSGSDDPENKKTDADGRATNSNVDPEKIQAGDSPDSASSLTQEQKDNINGRTGAGNVANEQVGEAIEETAEKGGKSLLNKIASAPGNVKNAIGDAIDNIDELPSNVLNKAKNAPGDILEGAAGKSSMGTAKGAGFVVELITDEIQGAILSTTSLVSKVPGLKRVGEVGMEIGTGITKAVDNFQEGLENAAEAVGKNISEGRAAGKGFGEIASDALKGAGDELGEMGGKMSGIFAETGEGIADGWNNAKARVQMRKDLDKLADAGDIRDAKTGFRGFLDKIPGVNKLVDAGETVAKSSTALATNTINSISNASQNVRGAVKGAADDVSRVADDVASSIDDVASQVQNAVKEGAENAGKVAGEVAEDVGEFAAKHGDEALDAAKVGGKSGMTIAKNVAKRTPLFAFVTAGQAVGDVMRADGWGEKGVAALGGIVETASTALIPIAGQNLGEAVRQQISRGAQAHIGMDPSVMPSHGTFGLEDVGTLQATEAVQRHIMKNDEMADLFDQSVDELQNDLAAGYYSNKMQEGGIGQLPEEVFDKGYSGKELVAMGKDITVVETMRNALIQNGEHDKADALVDIVREDLGQITKDTVNKEGGNLSYDSIVARAGIQEGDLGDDLSYLASGCGVELNDKQIEDIKAAMVNGDDASQQALADGSIPNSQAVDQDGRMTDEARDKLQEFHEQNGQEPNIDQDGKLTEAGRAQLDEFHQQNGQDTNGRSSDSAMDRAVGQFLDGHDNGSDIQHNDDNGISTGQAVQAATNIARAALSGLR